MKESEALHSGSGGWGLSHERKEVNMRERNTPEDTQKPEDQEESNDSLTSTVGTTRGPMFNESNDKQTYEGREAAHVTSPGGRQREWQSRGGGDTWCQGGRG